MSAIQQLLAAYRTGGDLNYSNVSLLLHCDGINNSTTFTDNSPSPKTLTGFSSAVISTAQSKFGGASLFLDGSNDYITAPADSGFQFGTGDFVIECFVRFSNSLPVAAVLISTYDSASTGWLIQRTNNSGGNLRFTRGDTVLLTSAWTTAAINTWYHVAVSRSGTNLRAFVDGTQIGSTVTDSTNFNDATALNIGRASLGGTTIQPLDGYMDEIRITKGVARYTGNFTVPTEAFPNF